MDDLPKLDPNPIITLAEGVKRIADSMEALEKSGLKRFTLLVLLRHSTKLSLRDIGSVLGALDDLAADYLA